MHRNSGAMPLPPPLACPPAEGENAPYPTGDGRGVVGSCVVLPRGSALSGAGPEGSSETEPKTLAATPPTTPPRFWAALPSAAPRLTRGCDVVAASGAGGAGYGAIILGAALWAGRSSGGGASTAASSIREATGRLSSTSGGAHPPSSPSAPATSPTGHSGIGSEDDDGAGAESTCAGADATPGAAGGTGAARFFGSAGSVPASYWFCWAKPPSSETWNARLIPPLWTSASFSRETEIPGPTSGRGAGSGWGAGGVESTGVGVCVGGGSAGGGSAGGFWPTTIPLSVFAGSPPVSNVGCCCWASGSFGSSARASLGPRAAKAPEAKTK